MSRMNWDRVRRERSGSSQEFDGVLGSSNVDPRAFKYIRPELGDGSIASIRPSSAQSGKWRFQMQETTEATEHTVETPRQNDLLSVL